MDSGREGRWRLDRLNRGKKKPGQEGSWPGESFH
jgi:hypothetical protein